MTEELEIVGKSGMDLPMFFEKPDLGIRMEEIKDLSIKGGLQQVIKNRQGMMLPKNLLIHDFAYDDDKHRSTFRYHMSKIKHNFENSGLQLYSFWRWDSIMLDNKYELGQEVVVDGLWKGNSFPELAEFATTARLEEIQTLNIGEQFVFPFSPIQFDILNIISHFSASGKEVKKHELQSILEKMGRDIPKRTFIDNINETKNILSQSGVPYQFVKTKRGRYKIEPISESD